MTPVPVPPPELIHAQVERILASSIFARSERLRRFLRYCVQRSLAGEGEDLKEYRIGVEVFDRGETFDPRIDNIVRSHAHRLRVALQAYYEQEGAADALFIALPRGAYVTTFEERPSEVEERPSGVPAPRPSHRLLSARILALGLAIIIFFALGFFALGYVTGHVARSPAAPAAKIEAGILLPADLQQKGVGALSPDNRWMVFPAAGPGGNRLWLRGMDGASAHPLPGTDGGNGPFWSPDGRFVAFFANQKLWKVRVPGGPAQVLCNVPFSPLSYCGSWGDSGTILFAPQTQSTGVIYQIPDTGGEVRNATRLDPARAERAHRWPSFLPGGRDFLFFNRSLKRGLTGFYLGSLDSTRTTLVLAQNSISKVQVVATPDSARHYLLHVNEGALTARAFDLRARRVSDSPNVLATGLPFLDASYNFSASSRSLIFFRGSGRNASQLTLFDRTGRVLGKTGPPGDYHGLELSPDASRLAFVRTDEDYGTLDVWLMELARGVAARFTSDPTNEYNPVWAPDGREIAFTTERFGIPTMMRKALSGDAGESRLLATQSTQFAGDWSRDGQSILYSEDHNQTHFDLWILPWLPGPGQPRRVLATPANERQGRLSPDGRMVAYESDRTGRSEIFVAPVDPRAGSAVEHQVSSTGGLRPRWDPAGAGIYFLGSDAKLMYAPVPWRAGEPDAGVPQALFATGGASSFAVAADGKRLLINVPEPSPHRLVLPLIVNWSSDLP